MVAIQEREPRKVRPYGETYFRVLQFLGEQQKEKPDQPLIFNQSTLGREFGVSGERIRQITERIKEEHLELQILNRRQALELFDSQVKQLRNTTRASRSEIAQQLAVSRHRVGGAISRLIRASEIESPPKGLKPRTLELTAKVEKLRAEGLKDSEIVQRLREQGESESVTVLRNTVTKKK
ncbi:MAG: hypothetical protein ACOZBZ_04805 [Patescibacteria group bacterium]